MSRHTTTEGFDVRVGGMAVSYGEVRYTYTIGAGAKVTLEKTEIRMGFSDARPWRICDDDELLQFDVSDAWFIERAAEDAE